MGLDHKPFFTLTSILPCCCRLEKMLYDAYLCLAESNMQ